MATLKGAPGRTAGMVDVDTSIHIGFLTPGDDTLVEVIDRASCTILYRARLDAAELCRLLAGRVVHTPALIPNDDERRRLGRRLIVEQVEVPANVTRNKTPALHEAVEARWAAAEMEADEARSEVQRLTAWLHLIAAHLDAGRPNKAQTMVGLALDGRPPLAEVRS